MTIEMEIEKNWNAANAKAMEDIQNDYDQAKDRYIDAADKQSRE